MAMRAGPRGAPDRPLRRAQSGGSSALGSLARSAAMLLAALWLFGAALYVSRVACDGAINLMGARAGLSATDAAAWAGEAPRCGARELVQSSVLSVAWSRRTGRSMGPILGLMLSFVRVSLAL